MPALVSRLAYYLKVYRRLAYVTLMDRLEYRVNFIVWNLMEFIWFGLGWGVTTLIFSQINAIAGWDKPRVLLLYAIMALYNDFMWMFIWGNTYDFSHLIRHGKLDYVLTKPISSRFLVSFGETEFNHLPRIIFLIWFINRQLQLLNVSPGVMSWLLFAALFLCGLLAFYSLIYTVNITGIWFVKLFNVNDIFTTLAGIGRYPLDIFKRQTRLILTYLIPTAFVAYLPAKALLGEGRFSFLLVGILVVGVTFGFSQWFWRFALKHYSSASS